MRQGSFIWPDNGTVQLESRQIDRSIIEAALKGSGLSVSDTVDDRHGVSIRLLLTDQLDFSQSPEAYRLEITSRGVTLQATTDAGLFYGLQSLLQLRNPASGAVATALIEDAPRFAYRGAMIDVSRHFRSKESILKQMDAMAAYKMNRLHLHLTDAAGWRIQIDRYPLLTALAAWRPEATWKEWWNGKRRYCRQEDGQAQGGFYTKNDIREIVEYARRRCITVIPEIEMPSHSEEVLTAYPELSCTHEPYRQSDFCVGNERTFEFLEGVLSEVMELFPSHYIHVGGDEAGKASWNSCPLCQKRMKQEGMTEIDQLQSYLISRIERFLNNHGRDLIGWDEILEGGLAPNATVMSWRGEEGGRKAMAAGHKVVMSPGGYCYLDAYQDAPSSQPEAIGGYLPLEKVYSYDPLPADATPQQQELLLGVQGNVWTEYIPTEEHLEYMLYPRIIALAEVGWTMPERKSWTDFHQRIIRYVYPQLKDKGYHAFDPTREQGNRPEALQGIHHLAEGKKVTFVAPYWKNYPANGEQTLTDGLRGGWNYNDRRWMGFVGDKWMDVVIDLEQSTTLHSIYADFMQICGPGVFLPAKVIISASDNGTDYTVLQEIPHEVVNDDAVSFRRFGWEGEVKARYVRYQTVADARYGGVHFVDEIVVE